ncbi:DUF192 domain-containing protein [Rhizobium sp. FKL33]|uniref:DUF192 domain-containing protein n=1 Tax=Rhizobium sp. FKL33 TaxID=2562307 RepID=UPI001FEE05FC|nr:DUF192 domain-containing protein [Rhizobium sp. FKL33]
MILRRTLLKSAVLALFLCPLAALATELPNRETLTIARASGGSATFTVEVAATEEERRIGLMDRKSMAQDRGMLFDFGETRPVYMWMRNTYIPLDMLFIDGSGLIRHIRAETTPLSDDIIDSHAPVRFVLEINGGLAAKLGIAVGDTVASPAIAKAAAP